MNAPKSNAAPACTDSGLIAAPSPMLVSSPVPASKSALVPAGGSSELVPGKGFVHLFGCKAIVFSDFSVAEGFFS